MFDLLYVLINFIVYSIVVVGFVAIIVGVFSWRQVGQNTKRDEDYNDKTSNGSGRRPLF